MRFGSVCSGIEAASVAWEPLGWKAAWFSEIEPFPSAVLKHHYPDTPNLGDMTTLPDRIMSGEVEAPDLFCGGTPCQAFSVAGLRRSLDDARGNLSLTFCEIADAIDDVRRAGGKPPAIVFWENVPGVLSTADNAFGCFLGALAGCDTAIDPLAATGWTDAGVVAGPQRTVAWRILDAQFFGVAQRRRRVFVCAVGNSRKGFDPAAVLFEWEGVRRDSAPSREAGQGVARGAAEGPGVSGERGMISAFGGGQNCSQTDVSTALHAHPGGSRLDFQTETFISHTLRSEGFDASEDGTGRGTPLVPVAFSIMPMNSGKDYKAREVDVAQPLMAAGPVGGNQGGDFIAQPVPMINMQGSKGNAVAQADGPSFTLNAMHGHDVHAVAVPVAQPYTLAIRGRGDSHNLEYRQDGTANALLTPNGGRGGIGVGAIAVPDVAGTMKSCAQSGGWSNSADHAAAGYMVPVAYSMITANTGANGLGVSAEIAPTLDRAQPAAVAFHPTQDPIRSPQSSEVTAQVAAVFETLYNQGFSHESTYASAQETHAGKILRTLREAVGEEAFTKWGLGILGSLQSPEILRQALYGIGIRPAAFSRSWVVYCALSRSENGSGWLLQSLRETGCEGCPPQGWEPSEQLARELGAYLSELSQPGAQASRFMRDLWWAAQGAGVLRQALSAVQEVGRPAHGQSQPAYGGMQVRRLTVEECEFLQGFPRGYTAIPWRGKPADQCPDGPRYKALGNSWAVPVVRWIGRRIQSGIDA